MFARPLTAVLRPWKRSSTGLCRLGAAHRWGRPAAIALLGTSLPLASCATACCQSTAQVNDQHVDGTRLTFVLFGDSITSGGFKAGGWGQRLGELYMGRADMLNRGSAGYNTRFARLAVKRLLRSEGAWDAREREMNDHLASASLWTVMLGTNDSGLPDGGFSVVHVPVEEYERNLTEIVHVIQAATRARCGREARVVVLTPATVDDAQVSTGGKASHTNANTSSYAEAARRVATKCGAVLCDVFAEMDSQGQPAQFVCDGIHLSEKGNEVVYELLRKSVKESIPDLAPEARPMELPGVQHLWGDQDFKGVFATY